MFGHEYTTYNFGKLSFLRNPFNAEIRTDACTVVKRAVVCNGKLDVSWKRSETDGKISTVGCFHIFTEQYQTFFSASLQKFYPLFKSFEH